VTRPVLSFIAFYACWFACVGGAARGWPWLGPIAVLVYVAADLRSIPSGAARSRQVRMLVLSGVVGWAADSILVLAGVLRFPAHAVLGWPSTAWMVALWVLQAAVLGGPMSWLRDRFVLAAVVGAIGGPLAYLAGERMGAAVLGPTRPSAMAAIAALWTVAMPLLVWMERRARVGEARGARGERFAQ
jgi:hypothetical protein